MTELLLKGIIVGFAIAAPVGPIGLLIMRRTVAEGRRAGFVSGLGAATADTLYSGIAVLALSAVTGLLTTHRDLVQLLGGLFMVGLGVHTWRTIPPVSAAPRPLHERNLRAAYVYTGILTLANPLTLLGAAGIIAANGLAREPNDAYRETAAFLIGVFGGSTAWWLILCVGAAWLGRRINPHFLRTLNHIVAVFILVVGLWQLGLLAHRWL